MVYLGLWVNFDQSVSFSARLKKSSPLIFKIDFSRVRSGRQFYKKDTVFKKSKFKVDKISTYLCQNLLKLIKIDFAWVLCLFPAFSGKNNFLMTHIFQKSLFWGGHFWLFTLFLEKHAGFLTFLKRCYNTYFEAKKVIFRIFLFFQKLLGKISKTV